MEPTIITKLRKDLKWPTLEQRRQDIRLTYMNKIMNNEVAISREDLGLEKNDSHTRAKHKFKLRERPARTTNLKSSFVNRTIPQWNCLPAAVAEADSVVAFKSRLAALRDKQPQATGAMSILLPAGPYLDLDIDIKYSTTLTKNGIKCNLRRHLVHRTHRRAVECFVSTLINTYAELASSHMLLWLTLFIKNS